MRVLIIEDSPSIQAKLQQMIKQTGADVVGAALSAEEGLEIATRLKPDVITLDIELPGKSGLEILPLLKKACDASVIMLSALTNQGAEATLKALERGAFDYIPKNNLTKGLFTGEMLAERLEHAYQFVLSKRRGDHLNAKPKLASSAAPFIAPKILVLGVSTGGPAALQQLFATLPILPIPIVIVQHMPVQFIVSLAQRISEQTKHDASVLTQNQNLLPGKVYFAPGNKHTTIGRQFSRLFCTLSDEPKNLIHKPSVDVLFQTAAEVMGKELLAVVLTGMGKDGAEGAKTIRRRGGFVVAESQSSCIVYGMPKVLIENHIANFEFPLEDMSAAICRMVTGATLLKKSA